MHRTTPLVLLAAVTVTLTACQQSPTSVLGPSPAAVGTSAAHFDTSSNELAGALTQGVHHSAATDSGFACVFPFGLGLAEESHATRSDSGNQTLTCHAEAPPFITPDSARQFEGFPCAMHYDGTVTTDSKLLITPSGNMTLSCHSKD